MSTATTTKIEELEGRIKSALEAASRIADEATTADRAFTGEERESIERHMAEARTLRDQRKSLTDRTELTGRLKSLGDELGAGGGDTGVAELGDAELWTPNSSQSLGEAFTSSAQFKQLMAQAPNGRFGEQQRVQSAPFGVKTLLTGTSRTSAGGLIPPDWRGLLDGLGQFQRPLRIRNLVTGGTTGVDMIEYVIMDAVTNKAAAVAEAKKTDRAATVTAKTPAADIQVPNLTDLDGVKPESGMKFKKMTALVRTLAHWLPITKRGLADAPGIRTLVDQFLRYGLEDVVDNQLINGTGADEQLPGVLNTNGILTEKRGKGTDDNVLDTLRRARTKITVEGRANPTAYVMHPMDWQAIDLLKDSMDRYYGLGPFGIGPRTLWGLPVVESESVLVGTAIVADWSKAVLWDRQQSAITVSDSHSDFFIRNMVAILGELRCAFGIIRPKAFCKVTLTPEP